MPRGPWLPAAVQRGPYLMPALTRTANGRRGGHTDAVASGADGGRI